MTINATFIGQIIVFLILLWFIAKFVTPVVSQALAERTKKIADGLAAADRGQKDLAEARERAKQIEDLAARRSSETIEAAKQDAQAEGARIVQSARDEAATETGRAREELRREYGRLVVAGASRLLEREIDPRTHEQLLDQLASEIGRG